MLKKSLVFLLLLTMSIVLCIQAYAADGSIDVYKGAPTVDGIIDDMWKNVPSVSPIGYINGESTVINSTIKALWDGDYIYLLYEVPDASVAGLETKHYDDGGSWWDEDSVELFFTNTGVQYAANRAGLIVHGNKSNAEAAATQTSDGYIVELKIKMDSPINAGDQILFASQINDAKSGETRNYVYWAGKEFPSGECNSNQANYGTLNILADAVPVPAATSADASKTGDFSLLIVTVIAFSAFVSLFTVNKLAKQKQK